MADRMRRGLISGAESMKNKKGEIRVKRIIKKCFSCYKPFESREKENRKFCSSKCAAIHAFKQASEKVHEESVEKHKMNKILVEE
jgi:endogenous inhibitor of DNA gyrase (YacG/DUF329 family)